MTDNLTPAQKREATLRRKHGEDWRDKIGQLAKEGKQQKHGEDGYKVVQGKAGAIGGAKVKATDRPFSRDHNLAKTASAKGLQKRWAKDDK